MINILIAGLGGFIGASSRYWLSSLIQESFKIHNFPLGTLLVNMIGCLFIGIMSALAEPKEVFSPEIRIFLLIGILGGFTSFSAFSIETLKLLTDSHILRAIANVLIQVFGGLLFVWIGINTIKLFN